MAAGRREHAVGRDGGPQASIHVVVAVLGGCEKNGLGTGHLPSSVAAAEGGAGGEGDAKQRPVLVGDGPLGVDGLARE